MIQRFFTTPIYYANDVPHLGHVYTTVAADILARFCRLSGDQVFLTTGTDEHGSKIAQAAAQRKVCPQTHVDTMAATFVDMIGYSGVQIDDFVRTTQPRHKACATALWTRLADSGALYLGQYQGWYAVRDEAFYDEDELTQTPDGPTAPSGAPVQWVEEPCYFFRLSAFADRLIHHYQDNPDCIGPQSRYNEVMGFLQGGLQDLAVSRTNVTWGIPVPGDSRHVMYVWIDALANYLTVLGYPQTFDPDSPLSQQAVAYARSCTHLLGKDILRFHAVYWPSLLMAAGLPLPRRLFAHGWWLSEGAKMSKSLGNVIDPKALMDTYGRDGVRYFLFRHVRFGQDGDCVEALLRARLNQELADRLGNLAHRVLTFVHKTYQGALPTAVLTELDAQAQDLVSWGPTILDSLTAKMDCQDIYGYLEDVYHAIVKGNQFMTDLAPWTLAKTPDDPAAASRMRGGLSALLHFLRDVAILLLPIMPDKAAQLLSMVDEDALLPKGWVSQHSGQDLARLLAAGGGQEGNPLEKDETDPKPQAPKISCPQPAISPDLVPEPGENPARRHISLETLGTPLLARRLRLPQILFHKFEDTTP